MRAKIQLVGPTCQWGAFFREIHKPFPSTVRNKEELSLCATMDLVGPSHQALHIQSSFDDSRLLTHPTKRSEVVDDGEAPDGNDPKMGRRGSGVAH